MAVFEDLSGRSAGPATLRTRGVVVVSIIAVVAVLLTAYARGYFESTFALTIDAATVGDGLAPGAEVKFRGLAIGSVEQIETLGFGRQRIELSIDGAQSAELTDTLQAQFTSSNLFGSTAIELISDGTGGALAENSTLTIAPDSANVTVTSVFRRVAELTKVLDSDQIEHLRDLLARISSDVSGSLKPYFDTARMLTENQIDPLALKLHRGGELGQGIDDLVPPLLDLVVGVVDNSAYYEPTDNRTRTLDAIDGLSDDLLYPLGKMLETNNPNLSTLLSTTLDLLVPITASLGTLAPAYDRVPTVIDGVSDVFPIVDGAAQLQLDVIVRTMPNLASAVDAYESQGEQ
ncbi:MCE family protein [Rhodococcus fascians]|nr:MCE family protein [Rhodococcus fascians]